MARIEYLIQHPNEVEFTDLELLNTEIEKYPYFYSLRALKLLALKKGNDSNFDQELKITSVYSTNRKHLYNFIQQEGKLEEDSIIEEVDNNIISETENPIEIIEETSVENENSLIEIREEETNVIDEINEPTSEVDENKIGTNNVHSEVNSEENTSNSENELSIAEETIVQSGDIISEDVELIEDESSTIEVEDDSILNENIILENPIDQDESIEIIDNSTENIASNIQETDSFIENSEDISPVEITENSQDSGEFTINEPTIESIIEEFKQQDFTSIEVDNSLIDFDLPSVEEKVDIDQSVEHSIEVAKLFIENETESLPTENIVDFVIEVEEPKIEQVSLVNRSPIEAEEKKSTEIQKTVSTLNLFQIQNIKNEVVGGFEEEKLIETIDDEVSIPTQEIINHIVESDKIEENIEVHTQEVEITSELKETISSIDPIEIDNVESNPVEEIKKTISSKEDALSFNDWLKLTQDQSETTPEKEIKYQIIDEFLEKNPKITPIKKQEIPESKNQIKEVKQTDFSDLMTETLAQIYIEQKQYEKAIRAYKILSLKYPEKNSLFAKQIKEIEILKNSK